MEELRLKAYEARETGSIESYVRSKTTAVAVICIQHNNIPGTSKGYCTNLFLYLG